MRKTLVILVAAMMVGMTIPAFAELQNVQVGGSLRIRGNWLANTSFDNNGPDLLAVEQRTKINVNADFTDDVHAFIELDSYDVFGDGFRGLDSGFSNYNSDRGFSSGGQALSGFDGDSSGSPVNFYQGYVEMREAWGYPITVRIGRSEFQQGDEFLIGNNDTSSNFRGLSFDGVWGSYKNDTFNVGAFWTRPFTDLTVEHSGDINFSGIHGEYTGIENMSIGGYYYFYHGASTAINGLPEAQALHTVGARFSGNRSQFDWALNGAYQFGDSGTSPLVDVSAFAVQGAVGYTFDVNMQPRIFVNGAYYDGQELDDTGAVEDAAFNRLFSDHEYSEFLDNTDLSNFWNVGGGVSAQVTESINLKGLVNYLQTVEDFGNPDSSLGLELEIIARYNYSEDLYFEAGYAHLFVGDAVQGGAIVTQSGYGMLGGDGQDDDLDYVYIETGIKF